MTAPIVYCADIVATYGGPEGPLVLIERLGSNPGIALLGGKQDPGESLLETACREFREETGLTLVVTDVLETRAAPGRDGRGHYVSTVFAGTAAGTPQEEAGKTRVLLCSPEEALALEHAFVLDHFSILFSWLTRQRR